jgi:hypothetical protein
LIKNIHQLGTKGHIFNLRKGSSFVLEVLASAIRQIKNKNTIKHPNGKGGSKTVFMYKMVQSPMQKIQ